MEPAGQLRILTLLASATEIVCALGFRSRIVGRSHECDYPPDVRHLPQVTSPRFAIEGSSRAIDERIKTLAGDARALDALGFYEVSPEHLRELRPTHIVTQTHCEVCAVSLRDVEIAVARVTACQPRIISLQPDSLDDVFRGILDVAAAFDARAAGERLVSDLRGRMATVAARSRNPPKRTVALVEWIEPLMAAGNWMPELAEMAGGRCVFGQTGEHSPQMPGDSLLASDPDVIVISPCGFEITRTLEERSTLEKLPGWSDLRAVRSGRVFIVDGNQYFNRPGPRLVESLEILAEILHPDTFDFGHRETGWVRWDSAD